MLAVELILYARFWTLIASRLDSTKLSGIDRKRPRTLNSH